MSKMSLDTLIEILNDYRDELGGDAEVRLMTQQSWPFENRIAGVTSESEMNAEDEDEDEDTDDSGDAECDPVVYIVEGGQLRYGNKRAWDNPRSR